MFSPALPLNALNGHIVRREDSRGSLFMDPGTPDSAEVTLFHPFHPSLQTLLIIEANQDS